MFTTSNGIANMYMHMHVHRENVNMAKFSS